MTTLKKIGRLDRPDNHGSAQMFKNPILERLTRTHISIPITLWLVTGGISLYWGFKTTDISLYAGFGVLILGILGFTLLEYLMHRYIYHMIPDSPIKDKIQYNMHGVHHDYPKDKDRLTLPPFITLVYAVIFYYLFTFLMGDYGLFFLPGFMIGYAAYLGVHYMVHAYQPPRNFLRVLWVNHSIHHYKDPDAAFGVSSPLWDYILGTMPKKSF
jgi:4-hydroxysphinganine ceramide fatty acyl 2-hydroxylase